MRKMIFSLATMVGLALMASPCLAGFTLFDTAKDSMFIGRGEFTSLERTLKGDRLVFRCDTALKGNVTGEVTLEPFEIAPADAALGREAIVGFQLINGKYYFAYQRRGVFMAEDNLNSCDKALRDFIAVNAPHQPLIEGELRKRLEYQNLQYEGEYPADLMQAWRSTLVRQCSYHNSVAARDAAKVLFEHALFKGQASLAEIQKVAAEIPATPQGTTERAYMLLLVRSQASAHPAYETLISMLNEETADYNVGHIADYLLVKDRGQVFETLRGILTSPASTSQQMVNALQVLQAFKDAHGLVIVRDALIAQQSKGVEGFDKNVTRRALLAMRDTPDASSVDVIVAFYNSEICTAKFEFQKRALQALAVIDTDYTNNFVRHVVQTTKVEALKQFAKALLPENKSYRAVVTVPNED